MLIKNNKLITIQLRKQAWNFAKIFVCLVSIIKRHFITCLSKVLKIKYWDVFKTFWKRWKVLKATDWFTFYSYFFVKKR